MLLACSRAIFGGSKNERTCPYIHRRDINLETIILPYLYGRLISGRQKLSDRPMEGASHKQATKSVL